MKTRTILTGIAAAAMLAAPLSALAADLSPPSYQAPAYIAPASVGWNGFYLGVNAGYGWGTSDWDIPVLSIDPKGALVGGTVGYNMQIGSLVVGLEGDFDWANLTGNKACGAGNCEIKSDWLGTARARVGYAGFGGFMPYITGGAAFANVKATNSAFTSASDSMFGWTAGAGVEYAFPTSWSVKVEYLYADLGDFACSTACSATTPDNVAFTTNIVRAGINYRF